MHPTYRGLAFLLSLGSLPIACNKGDSESDTTGDTDDTGPGTEVTGGPAPTTSVGGSTTTSASEGASSTGSSDTSTDATTGDTTGTTGELDTGNTEPQVTTFLTSNTDTGDTGDTGDTFGDTGEPLPPPTDPVCLAYAAHIVECNPGYAGYRTYIAQYCEYYKSIGLRADGQACADAFEAYYVCATKLDCADILEGGCLEESMAANAACPSLDEGESESGFESESGSTGDPDTSSTG